MTLLAAVIGFLAGAFLLLMALALENLRPVLFCALVAASAYAMRGPSVLEAVGVGLLALIALILGAITRLLVAIEHRQPPVRWDLALADLQKRDDRLESIADKLGAISDLGYGLRGDLGQLAAVVRKARSKTKNIDDTLYRIEEGLDEVVSAAKAGAS